MKNGDDFLVSDFILALLLMHTEISTCIQDPVHSRWTSFKQTGCFVMS